ncbi:retrovirus-related Pol polyprotein from transposon 17.6 [Trichonephila inaurata madagascariensis]|uniref:Retrovirus-related Pol polyprotein from transposon 17.6 n=1 Tax=Trichonephila inaurata madagascariensis TaxID=2747483 RepID=A0A8X7C643_9ARAC|nr:retrovirus-related Pol polyprotein from transposon 17.6 [Trichonephila inaurata madagascariensis]
MTCLPVAEVEIECDLGTVTSKAAVIGNHLDQGRYILGNQTAALLQGIEENCSSDFGKVNTVVTRSQTRQNPKEKEDTIVEYVFELINRLKKCRDLATVRMEEVRDRRKKWYDKNAIKREFEQGDAVLVLTLNQPHKLAPQWKGPGKIEKRLFETNYVVIFDGNQEGKKVYHINMLKPYHKRSELLNVVLVDTEEITEPSELEEDFPYMLTDPNVFDFREIVENNQLKEILGDEQIMQLGKLLVKFSAIFSNIPGKTNLVEHDIDLISDKRVQHKPYRMTNRQNEILKAEIEMQNYRTRTI